MNKFKVGDKVYFPFESNKVLTVQENYDDDPDYPIKVDGFLLNTDGKYTDRDSVPSVIPATPEKHALLEALFEVEFEKPPVNPTSKDIIQAKLDIEKLPVPCWVSNDPNCIQPTCKNKWVFIKDCDDGRFSKFPYLDSTGKYWMHATPFDFHTCEAITELPE